MTWRRWLSRRALRSWGRRGPAAVLLALGLAYTLLFQCIVEPRTFPQGDNAIKFMLTRQVAAGDWGLALQPVRRVLDSALWHQGFVPFSEALMVPREGRLFPVYPPAFAFLSAPFFALLGFRGLYALPLLGTWLVWILAARACVALRLRGVGTGVALALLIFASPVTLNAWLFWEHSAALALAFGGLTLVLLRPWRRAPDPRAAFAGGLLVGLAPLLREEMLVAGGLLMAVVCLPWRPASLGLDRFAPTRLTPALGVALGWALFFGFNTLAYAHPLGLHVLPLQVARGLGETFSPLHSDLLRTLLIGLRTLLEHFPELLLCPLVLLPLRGRTARAMPQARLLLLVGLAYWIGLRLAFKSDGGKVWGPRFALVIVPLACLALGVVAEALHARRTRAARLGLLLVAAFGAVGFWVNSVSNVRRLAWDYSYRATLLRDMSARPETVVVYAHDFTGLQYVSAMGEKSLVLAEQGSALEPLAQALSGLGIERFLFLCDPVYPCGRFAEPARAQLLPVGRGLRLELVPDGFTGRYRIYRGLIRRRGDRGIPGSMGPTDVPAVR